MFVKLYLLVQIEIIYDYGREEAEA